MSQSTPEVDDEFIRTTMRNVFYVSQCFIVKFIRGEQFYDDVTSSEFGLFIASCGALYKLCTNNVDDDDVKSMIGVFKFLDDIEKGRSFIESEALLNEQG